MFTRSEKLCRYRINPFPPKSCNFKFKEKNTHSSPDHKAILMYSSIQQIICEAVVQNCRSYNTRKCKINIDLRAHSRKVTFFILKCRSFDQKGFNRSFVKVSHRKQTMVKLWPIVVHLTDKFNSRFLLLKTVTVTFFSGCNFQQEL